MNEIKVSKHKFWMYLAILSVLIVIGQELYINGVITVNGPVKENIHKYFKSMNINGSITSMTLSNSGIFNVVLDVEGQEFKSFATKDGKYLFPSGVDLTEKITPPKVQQPAQSEVTKTDKPTVELFVMSYCPYGTQIEKGMLPVYDLLKDKADIQIRFVDYIMHGDKETKENILQYCLQQQGQLMPYLNCFLNDSDSAKCRKGSQISVDSCIVEQTKKITGEKKGSYPIFPLDQELNTKYNVEGSPTLVINGIQVNSARDSESLKNAICNAFVNKPIECDQKLSATSPSPGFGFGEDTSGNTAQCG